MENLRLLVAGKSRRLTVIRCDNEFSTIAVKNWALLHKIQILPSVPHEHDTVRKVERLHRTASEMVVKYFINKPHLNSQYWGFAYLHCIDLLNIGSGTSDNPSAYFLMHGRPFDFKENPILPFGSVVAAHHPLAAQTALSGRSYEAIFIGIAHAHANAVIPFNPVTKKNFVRHSFKYLTDVESPISYTDVYSTETEPSPSFNSNFGIEITAEENSAIYSYVPLSVDKASASIKFTFAHINSSFLEKITNTTYFITDIVNLSSPDISKTPCLKFYDMSLYKSPPKDNDSYEYESISEFFSDKNYVLTNTNNSPTRPNARIRKINMLKAKLDFNIGDSPMSISQALKHKYSNEFMQAFSDEITSLKDMKTFTEYLGNSSDIPKGSLLSSKAIFSVVFNPDGSFKKFKARLVARGDMLKNIFDQDTYAGTVRYDTLRLLFSLVAEKDLDLVSHDVKTAFLYPSLKPEEFIYLRRPNGADDNIMPAIVKLQKCLYGLPQASKYFDDHLSTVLLSIGLTRLITDSEVFVLSRDDEQVILTKHVDDILLAGTRGIKLLSFVSKIYNLTTTIEPKTFVGLFISRDRSSRSLTITLPNYTNTIIEKFSVPSS